MNASTTFGLSLLLLLLSLIEGCSCFSINTQSGTAPPTKVLVTGASGRTGSLVLETLMKDPRFYAKGMVRCEQSAKKLMNSIDGDIQLDQIVVGDVMNLIECRDDHHRDDEDCYYRFDASMMQCLAGTQAMIICTSAVPRPRPLSLARALARAPLNKLRGKKPIDLKSIRFSWKNNQCPEMVDYYGQIAQIQLAKQLGVKQIVLVSSMGITNPNNPLNDLGKNADGSGDGDILIWKRKAEDYLMMSGLTYTIIHPGSLVDTPPGQEEPILDADDKLLQNSKRSISRADVARLCVAALTECQDTNVSLDCVAREVPEGQAVPTCEQALEQFIKNKKNKHGAKGQDQITTNINTNAKNTGIMDNSLKLAP